MMDNSKKRLPGKRGGPDCTIVVVSSRLYHRATRCQSIDLVMTCKTSVYGGRSPGTAPARRHGITCVAGHHGTLAALCTPHRMEAHQEARENETGPIWGPDLTDNLIVTRPGTSPFRFGRHDRRDSGLESQGGTTLWATR
jgi:hypothetical protein